MRLWCLETFCHLCSWGQFAPNSFNFNLPAGRCSFLCSCSFAAKAAWKNDNYRQLPKIGFNNNYWIKLLLIIGNCCFSRHRKVLRAKAWGYLAFSPWSFRSICRLRRCFLPVFSLFWPLFDVLTFSVEAFHSFCCPFGWTAVKLTGFPSLPSRALRGKAHTRNGGGVKEHIAAQ